MKEPTPAEIMAKQKAARLSTVSDLLDEQIDSMDRSVRVSVFGEIDKGTLTPDKAMAYWMQMHANHRLRGKLKIATTITQGE